jgi:hypothetical protein
MAISYNQVTNNNVSWFPNGTGGYQVGDGTPLLTVINPWLISLPSGTSTYQLTAPQITSGLLQFSPTQAVTLTLPLGTALDQSLPSSKFDFGLAYSSFDFCITLLAPYAVTLATNTGLTYVTNGSLPTITKSANYKFWKTGIGQWSFALVGSQ